MKSEFVWVKEVAMRKVEYDEIEANLVDKEFDDARLRCLFECPVSGAQFEGEAMLTAMGSPRQSIFSEIGYQIRRWVGEIVQSLFGSYQAEWIAEDAAGAAVDKAAESSGMKYSDETIRDGVVDAFESVQRHFVWDAANNQWIADDRKLDGEQAGWLDECLTKTAERHGGQVARPGKVASVEGTPEYRSDIDGQPFRIVIDDQNRPRAELQVEAASGFRGLRYVDGVGKRGAESDPWAEQDTSDEETPVAPDVVAVDEATAEAFDNLEPGFAERLAGFVRDYEGRIIVEPDRLEIGCEQPLNEIASRDEYLDTVIDIAQSSREQLAR